MIVLTAGNTPFAIFALAFAFCSILMCAMSVWAAMRGPVDVDKDED